MRHLRFLRVARIRGHENESAHEIYDAGLGDDIELHRFLDDAGQECSALYTDDKEIVRVPKEREKELYAAWRCL